MKITLNCPVCQKQYEADTVRIKHGRQTTCSKKCSYIFRAAKISRSIEVICATCGKKIIRSKSTIKGKYGVSFCSRACHYIGRTSGKSKRIVTKSYNISENAKIGWAIGAKKTRAKRLMKDNYKHSDETKQKIREATCRQLSNCKSKGVSKLEERVIPILTQIGIDFVWQYPVRNEKGQYVCVFDFFIPSKNIVIEVNGTFWHTDRRVYKEPMCDIQKRCLKKWNEKKIVINTLGYTLVELWEKDIKEIGDKYIMDSIKSVI